MNVPPLASAGLMDNKKATFDNMEDSEGFRRRSFRGQAKMKRLNWPLGSGHCMQQGETLSSFESRV